MCNEFGSLIYTCEQHGRAVSASNVQSNGPKFEFRSGPLTFSESVSKLGRIGYFRSNYNYSSLHLLLHQANIISFLTGDVRLVDGGTNNQGRIEIYFNDTWWAICGNRFNWEAFDIVCSMINLPYPHERYSASEFGRGNQSIIPMGFSCDEGDSSLLDCRQEDDYEHYCGDDIVGVSCGELVMAGKKLMVFDHILNLYLYQGML